MKLKIKLNQIKLENETLNNVNLDKINIININYNFTKIFEPISSKSNKYIKECFDKAFNIIKKTKSQVLLMAQFQKSFFENKFLELQNLLLVNLKSKNNMPC